MRVQNLILFIIVFFSLSSVDAQINCPPGEEDWAQNLVAAGVCNTCQCVRESFTEVSPDEQEEQLLGELHARLQTTFENELIPEFVDQLTVHGHLSPECSIDKAAENLCPKASEALDSMIDRMLNRNLVDSCLSDTQLISFINNHQSSSERQESRDWEAQARLNGGGAPFEVFVGEQCSRFYDLMKTSFCDAPSSIDLTQGQVQESLGAFQFTNSELQLNASETEIKLYSLHCHQSHCRELNSCSVANREGYNLNQLLDDLQVRIDLHSTHRDERYSRIAAPICVLFECEDFDEGADVMAGFAQSCQEKRAPPRTLAEVIAELGCDEFDDELCSFDMIQALLQVEGEDQQGALHFEIADLPSGEFDLEAGRAHMRRAGVSEHLIAVLGEGGVRRAFGLDSGYEIVAQERSLTASMRRGQENARGMMSREREQEIQEIAQSHRERQRELQSRVPSGESFSERNRMSSRPQAPRAVEQEHIAEAHLAPIDQGQQFSSLQRGATSVGGEAQPSRVAPSAQEAVPQSVIEGHQEMIGELRASIDEARRLQDREREQALQGQIDSLQAELNERNRVSSNNPPQGRAPASLPDEGSSPSETTEAVVQQPQVELPSTSGPNAAGGGAPLTSGGQFGDVQRSWMESEQQHSSAARSDLASEQALSFTLDELSRATPGETITVRVEGEEGPIYLELRPQLNDEDITYRLSSDLYGLPANQLEALLENPFIQRYLHRDDYQQLRQNRTPSARTFDLNQHLSPLQLN